MNDVVFADRAEIFKKQKPEKFLKCLKAVVKDSNEYAVIPPNVQFGFESCTDGDLIICIEQPLIPPFGGVRSGANRGGGIKSAAEQAAIYLKENKKAVLSALGGLIVSYVTDDFGTAPHPVTGALKAEIENSFSDCTYSVDSSISKLPLNYDYVRKLFKKETGITPHEYLTILRMERAREIILSGVTNRYSNYTVSQIAEACGFSEPLYFSRVFKKYFKVAPSLYTKE